MEGLAIISIHSGEPGPDPYIPSAILCERADRRCDWHSWGAHCDQFSVVSPEQAFAPRPQPEIAAAVRQRIGRVGCMEALGLSIRRERALAPSAQTAAQHADP